jgi:hypothetical protein
MAAAPLVVCFANTETRKRVLRRMAALLILAIVTTRCGSRLALHLKPSFSSCSLKLDFHSLVRENNPPVVCFAKHSSVE